MLDLLVFVTRFYERHAVLRVFLLGGILVLCGSLLHSLHYSIKISSNNTCIFFIIIVK